jgi:hypothetical protein
MTSISLDAISDIYDIDIPFCDKDFKSARLVLDLVNAVCSALFYKIVSSAYILGRTKYCHEMHRYYSLLASNEKDKARSVYYKIMTFKRHGSEIIDFGENGGSHLNQVLANTHLKIWQSGRFGTQSKKEQQTLEYMYGSEIVDQWKYDTGMEIHFNHMNLKAGCCLGMSLDFISCYLKELESGKSFVECAKAIAPQFAKGASNQAQMAQLCQDALIESYTSPQSPFVQVQKWFSEEKDKIAYLPTKDQLSAYHKLFDQFYKKLDLLTHELCELEMHVLKDLTKGFAFESLDQAYRFAIGSSSDKQNAELNHFIQSAKQGVFIVGLRDKMLRGHSIVFIRTGEGKDIIFDPNKGTLAVDSRLSAARLVGITKSIGFNKISFVPINLK